MQGFVIAVVIALLAGCAPVAPKPAVPVAYRCDGGREFALDVAPSGDAAVIDISGMSFRLFREPATTDGTRFSCSVLSVWRHGDMAEVQMEDAQFLTNCRPIPSPSLRP